MLKNRRWYPVPLFACSLLAPQAQGNGINPPQTSGAKTVIAVCTDRLSGDQTTVRRARIVAGAPSGSIELKLDKAGAKLVQLSQVVRLDIPSDKPASNGFARATLELTEPAYQGQGAVRLQVGKKPVRLTGFTADFSHVDIPLRQCKLLVLTSSASADPDPGSVSKK